MSPAKRRPDRLAIALLLIALPATAADHANIVGTVTDADTNLPIANAELVLRYANTATRLNATASDAPGAFHFTVDRPGSYAVDAAAPSYYGLQSDPAQPTIKIEDSDLTPGTPTTERKLTIALSRAATITGELHDATTRQPLPGLVVKALRVTWLRGHRHFTNEATASTDDKGVFHLDAPPGDYFLQLWQVPAANRITAGRAPDYTAKSPPPKLYPAIFWPTLNPDADPDTGIPLTARPGAELNVGTIPLAKIPAGRIRGQLPLSACPEHLSAHVNFGLEPAEDRALGGQLTVSCGASFTLENLSPGRYRIEAIFRGASGAGGFNFAPNSPWVYRVLAPVSRNTPPAFAHAEVQLPEGGDQDLTLTLEPVFSLTGNLKCECADATKPLMQELSVQAGPRDSLLGLSFPDPVSAGGIFRIAATFTAPIGIEFTPVSRSLFVKELNYNGKATRDRFLPDPAAPSQSLTVVLTDRPAHISGTVTVPGSKVTVVPWPLRFPDSFPGGLSTSADEAGRFSLEIAEGTYRIVAIQPPDRARSEMPGVIAAWLEAAPEFTVAPGESRTMSLQPPAK